MVAKNHCLMMLRNNNRLPVEINEQLHATADELADTKKLQENDLLVTNMEHALSQLNKEQQQCVTLFYLHKKSYQEIVADTSFSLLQVKSHIQNGKRNLKIMLERLQVNEQ